MVMPLREYYPVDRAAELLGCKVDDLLHWASIGAINLYVEFKHGTGYVHFFGYNVEPENKNLENYNEQDFEEAKRLKDDFLDNGFVSDGASFILNIHSDNSETDEYIVKTGSIIVNFNGFWALPHSFYGKTELYSITPGEYDVWESSNKRMFISFGMDEYLSFGIDDLYLMRRDFNLISKSKDQELPNYYNGGMKMPKTNKLESNKKEHMTEFHAQKRESILKAAIYMMLNHRELCTNNTKWAEAINQHAHKFWEDGEMPLSVEKVTELLGKAKRSLK